MLVLSRKKDESIVIGDNEVVITVLSIRGDQVRIAVAADASIPVHREEIHLAMKSNEKDSQRR